MKPTKNKQSVFLAVAVAATLFAAASPASAFGKSELRCAPQENTVRASDSQSVLAGIRAACPLLGSIVEEFALLDLGEAFPGESVKSRSPEIAVAAAFAASGDTASMRHHARLALDAGATELEFRKLLYLTTVNAGAPRAIEATRALAELFSERNNRCLDRSAGVDARQF